MPRNKDQAIKNKKNMDDTPSPNEEFGDASISERISLYINSTHTNQIEGIADIIKDRLINTLLFISMLYFFGIDWLMSGIEVLCEMLNFDPPEPAILPDLFAMTYCSIFYCSYHSIIYLLKKHRDSPSSITKSYLDPKLTSKKAHLICSQFSGHRFLTSLH